MAKRFAWIQITPRIPSFPTRLLAQGSTVCPRLAVEKYFNQPALPAVLAAGWQPVTYRQNTELAVGGVALESARQVERSPGKGYFTGSATPNANETIKHSYGYGLPHRGFTRNDGADTRGFSRLTDGDRIGRAIHI